MASAVKVKTSIIEEADDADVLRSIVRDLNKKLGDKASVVMGDEQFDSEPESFIPCSSTLLNRAIGGGFAVGRIVEILGDVQTGKSLLGLDVLSHCQNSGGYSFYLDSEFGTGKNFLKKLCHVDETRLAHIEVRYQEAAWQTVDEICKQVRGRDAKAPIAMMVDSVPALPGKARLALDFDEQAAMGLEQRIVRGALARLLGEVASNDMMLILTNHEIYQMNTMPGQEKTLSWGGRSIRHYASTRLKTSIIGTMKDDNGEVQAQMCRVTVKKNRFDPPGRVVEYPINVRGEHPGIDDHSSLVDFLWKAGALGMTKGWVEWEGVRMRRTELVEKSRSLIGCYDGLKKKALEVYDVRPEYGD